MSKFDGSIGSKIFDEGMTPAQWIVVLAEMDIIISETDDNGTNDSQLDKKPHLTSLC